MNHIRTAALGLSALLLAGLAAAPASASSDLCCGPPIVSPVCPPENPDAWVNYCVDLTPISTQVHAYELDQTPETTRVCVTPTLCINLPVILELLDAKAYPVTYYNVHQDVSVNFEQIKEDGCDVVGIACPVLEALLGALASASAAEGHGMVLDGLGDVGSDGSLDVAFFTLPGGETVAVPFG